MYPRTIIDSLPAVPNRDQLTHKDLHAHFSTGQSILLSGVSVRQENHCGLN